MSEQVAQRDDTKAVVARKPRAVAEVPVPEPVSASVALIQMIERAARDPSVDIDKMQQLLVLRREMEDRAAKLDFDEAMKSAQSEMQPIATDATNPQTRSKYASYAALDRALRPIYTKYGFSVEFDTGETLLPDHVRVLCNVSRGGHTRQRHIDMPSDGKGARGGDVMTKTHATGSAVSYGMRYLLKMAFNIAVGDDDGNAASNTDEYISEKQVAALKKLIEDTGGNVEKFCKFAKVEKLGEIYASRYDAAVAAVNRAAADRKAKQS